MKEKSTILIVDDSELNRTVLANILGDEYNFIEAENGARAIELLRTHTDIDLILLDMVMPEMNGFDVLTAMNNNRQIEDIPVVMISAENGIEHIERAYDLGVTDYISRPFDCMVVPPCQHDTGCQAEAADAAGRRADLRKEDQRPVDQ
ncbi:MAG: response regulator [Butyricicoccaceae bacterium]